MEDTRYLIGQEGTPGQGPFMRVILHVTGGVVDDAKYQTYGCPASEACGERMAEWVMGRGPDEAELMTEEDILAGTGPMPLGRGHCPGLAVGAMRDAVRRDREATKNEEECK